MLIAAHYVTMVTAYSSHGAIAGAGAGAHCCVASKEPLLLHGREVGDFNGLVRARLAACKYTFTRRFVDADSPANN
jgi:hypothetical protein